MNKVLDRVLDPVIECLTPEVALRLANLRADPEVQACVERLAEKANEGQLSADEEAEYDGYLQAFHIVTILQAKARTLLERKAAG